MNLLRQNCPVHFDPEHGVWIVSQYRDVATVLRDSRQFSAAILGEDSFAIRSPQTGCLLPREDTLLASDATPHTRLRHHIAGFFTRQRLTAYALVARSALREIVNRVMPQGVCDVVHDVAFPVASRVMTELLGLAPDRCPDVARWMTVCGQTNARSRPPWLLTAFDDVLRELWSAISDESVRCETPRCFAFGANGSMSAAQALDACVTIMKGAADTTSHLTGNVLLALHRDPELSGRLRAAHHLIPACIEESLRYDSPVQMTLRQTTSETELADTVLPARTRVLALIGSANRDHTVFREGDHFILNRPRSVHLAFGGGPHQCPGAALARLQVSLILEALLAIPAMHVVPQSLEESPQTGLRGPRRLLVAW